MELTDGSFVILGVMVFTFFGVAFGYFTRIGSGINPRPYGNAYGGAPGAHCPGNVSGRDPRVRMDWSRGTR